eukprot:2733614-Prymnesium_polylepis.1
MSLFSPIISSHALTEDSAQTLRTGHPVVVAAQTPRVGVGIGAAAHVERCVRWTKIASLDREATERDRPDRAVGADGTRATFVGTLSVANGVVHASWDIVELVIASLASACLDACPSGKAERRGAHRTPSAL